MDPREAIKKMIDNWDVEATDVLKIANQYKKDFAKGAKSEFHADGPLEKLIDLHRDFIDGMVLPSQAPEAKIAIQGAVKKFNDIFKSIDALKTIRELHLKRTNTQIAKEPSESEKLKIYAAEIIALTSTIPEVPRIFGSKKATVIADHKREIEKRADAIMTAIKNYELPKDEERNVFKLIRAAASKQTIEEDDRRRSQRATNRTEVDYALKAFTRHQKSADDLLSDIKKEVEKKENADPHLIFEMQEKLRESEEIHYKRSHELLTTALAKAEYPPAIQQKISERSKTALDHIKKQRAVGLETARVSDDKTRKLKEIYSDLEKNIKSLGAVLMTVKQVCMAERVSTGALGDVVSRAHRLHNEIQLLYARAQELYGSDGRTIQQKDAARSANDFYMLNIYKSSILGEQLPAPAQVKSIVDQVDERTRSALDKWIVANTSDLAEQHIDAQKLREFIGFDVAPKKEAEVKAERKQEVKIEAEVKTKIKTDTIPPLIVPLPKSRISEVPSTPVQATPAQPAQIASPTPHVEIKKEAVKPPQVAEVKTKADTIPPSFAPPSMPLTPEATAAPPAQCLETKDDAVKAPQSEVKSEVKLKPTSSSSAPYRSHDEKQFFRMTQDDVNTLPAINGSKWTISDLNDDLRKEAKFRTITNGENSFFAYPDRLTTNDENVNTYLAMIEAYRKLYPLKMDSMVITPKSQEQISVWQEACKLASVPIERIVPPAPPVTSTLIPATVPAPRAP